MTKFTDRKRNTFVPAPSPLAVASPQDYLARIYKVMPDWGTKLKSAEIKDSFVWCALWAAAVAVGNACRISEVLRIEVRHVSANGLAVALGSKGSSARMIYLGMHQSEIDHILRLPPRLQLFPVRYQSVWRAVAYNGLRVQEPSHVRMSATHSGRYGLVQKLAPEIGERAAGEAIGHKSARSVTYYAHPEICGQERAIRKAQANTKKLLTAGPQLPEFLGVDNA